VVIAERDRLERALHNLVDNAVKHGGGPVAITVREGTVVVRDHGPGFDDQDVERVFDRFYRAPAARSRPGCRPMASRAATGWRRWSATAPRSLRS
jgi:two-component system sensor histidine kinase MprB